MKIRPIFAWYDIWVGVFYDRLKRRVYVLPVPCFGLVLDFGESEFWGNVHYRGNSLDPICGVITSGNRDEVTCVDCINILEGSPAEIEKFRAQKP